MLKVVGASWLQTRISTYILVTVALLGIGAIILGEFGHVENDGTYSATVSWKQRGSFHIDFLGQGNDLNTVPLGAARAYYKTAIKETGWNVIEIQTSAEYPDTVQAYAAGLLEGSLTWQLIHHHWYNTVRAACSPRASTCRKMRHYLRENSAAVREHADRLAQEDPYWHMVRLFYAQLDGMEAGWKFGVRRSRQSVEIASEDFLWLTMASDMPDLERAVNGSDHDVGSMGTILLKALPREHFEPAIAVAQNTAAPYARMLRLLKRYNFGYHTSPNKDAELVPGRSIVMTSYPGALSSQDEYYLTEGEDRELIAVGTPLAVNNQRSRLHPKDQVMSASRIMAANRLAPDGRSWSRLLARHNSGTSNRQWVTVEPRTNKVWLIEQLPGLTHATDYSKEFAETGFLSCTGNPISREIKEVSKLSREGTVPRELEIARLQKNVTTLDQVTNLMRGCSHEENFEDTRVDQYQRLSFRGDLAEKPRPVGVIDTKVLLADFDGVETFEATSGPVFSKTIAPFDWESTFPNASHIGQPKMFNFESVTPMWVWV